MPFIASVSKIDLTNKADQRVIKEGIRYLFAKKFSQVDRLIGAFDNTEIKTRNFCKPLTYYISTNTFEGRNNDYQQTALAWSVKATEDCIARANIDKLDITDI